MYICRRLFFDFAGFRRKQPCEKAYNPVQYVLLSFCKIHAIRSVANGKRSCGLIRRG
jgi:hypothetical protein